MSIKLAPYAFIISIMLVLSSLIPSQASAESELSLLWEKEFNGHFYNEVATTSSNDTLMNTYTISENVNYEKVYTYDFMKVDSTGNVKDTKQLKDGITKIFEYNGQGYIAFFNKYTSNFELYNEDFQLVFSDVVSDEANFYNIFVKGDVIALTFDYESAVYYSLNTFEEIPASKIPVERYILEDSYNEYTDEITYSIHGITFANAIMEDIPLNASQLNGLNFWGGYSEEVVKYNGYLYLPINADDSEETFSMLYKINMQGNIVDNHVVGIDGDGSIAIDNKIIIASDQYYIYDLDTFEVTDVYKVNGAYPKIGKVNSDLYYYQSGNETIVANSINTKFILPGLVLPQETSSKYFIGYTDRTNNIYSTVTGSLLLTEENYQVGVHNNSVVAFKVNHNSTNSNTSIVKLYGTQTDLPVGEVYEANKKWTITFNAEVDLASVSNNSIYVLDATGNKVKDITFSTMGAKVEVYAPAVGYTSGKTYTLHVTKAVQSSKSTLLKKEETKTFKIK